MGGEKRSGESTIHSHLRGGETPYIQTWRKTICSWRKTAAHILLCQSDHSTSLKIKMMTRECEKKTINVKFVQKSDQLSRSGPRNVTTGNVLKRKEHHGAQFTSCDLVPPQVQSSREHSPSFLPSSASVHWVLAGQPWERGSCNVEYWGLRVVVWKGEIKM